MKKADIIKKLEAAGIEAPEGATAKQLMTLLPADSNDTAKDGEQTDETSDTESVIETPDAEEQQEEEASSTQPKEQEAPKLVTVECAAASLFEEGVRYTKGDELAVTEERAASLGKLVTSL